MTTLKDVIYCCLMVHCCHNCDCEWWLTGILYQKLMTRRCNTIVWRLICVILERNMAHHVSLVTVDSPGKWWWWPTSDIQVNDLHIMEWPLSDVILWYMYTYQCHNNDCKVISYCWNDGPLMYRICSQVPNLRGCLITVIWVSDSCTYRCHPF